MTVTEQELSRLPPHPMTQESFRASLYSSASHNFPLVRVLAFLLFSTACWASESTLVVNLSSDTGKISYGASGWLYGQAEDGIPTDSMMAPLKPQIAAQKPPDGLQHPAGDAMHIAPSFKRAGGKEIQIYIQDIYPDWPYNDPGIEDYIQKVQTVVRKAVEDPNHELFSYVPFNEPDNNWYGYSGAPFARLLSDWKSVYAAIRAIDPRAKIIGPNFYNYRHDTYRAFMTFARDSKMLPDEVSWHELQDNFFPGWYDRVADYRKLETGLGIAHLPIVINEYTRSTGDPAIPGKMIQWITRFENSKVQACLAYWVPSGTLSDLVARTWPNRPTGAWWLFKWYAGMTGHTVSVAPPDLYGFGLQGIAEFDPSKKQARIIFGGVAGKVTVTIEGIDRTLYSGNSVHVAVWSIATSGTEPSKGPAFEQESDYAAANGRIKVEVANAVETSAYYLIVTPAHNPDSANVPNRYLAEYADLSGSATVVYGTRQGYAGTPVVCYRSKGEARTEFATSVPEDGYYELTLNYGATAGKPRKLGLSLNGATPENLELSSVANSSGTQKRKFYLAGGINLFSFDALPDGSSDGLQIESIDLTPATGPIQTYESQDPATTMEGSAKLTTDPGTGINYATLVGAGTANFLQFNHVTVPSAGRYRMIVTYTNSEKGHSGQVERFAEISVNGGAPKQVYFRNTFDPAVFRTNVIDVELSAGANAIRFSNPQGFAPDIEKIQIANP